MCWLENDTHDSVGYNRDDIVDGDDSNTSMNIGSRINNRKISF